MSPKSLLRLAWWDSSGSRRKLLLFVVAVSFGISAFVGIASFTDDVKINMDAQAKTLLGSDVAFSRRQAYGENVEQILAKVPGERRRETSFTSMAIFPSGESRLTYVSAIENGFPFYGSVETEPAGAYHAIFTGPRVLVDQLLMAQYHITVGDVVRLGDQQFEVAGSLQRIPGETVFREIVAPRLYISDAYLPQTNLIQKGSRLNYRYHYRLTDELAFSRLQSELQEQLGPLNVSMETVSERRKNFGQTLENTYRLLSLVWCLALVLAGLGIASGTTLYISGKFNTIGALRCLGMRVRDVMALFVIQIAAAALLSGLLGSLLGIAMQQWLPLVFRDALPVDVTVSIHWRHVAAGLVLSLSVGLLFALEPIVRLRAIPALGVFRREEKAFFQQDRVSRLIWLALAMLAGALAVWQLGSRFQGLMLLGIFAAAILLLLGVSRLLTGLLRRSFQTRGPFVVRTGLAYLYRPRNQTALLFVTIGILALLSALLAQLGNSLTGQVGAALEAGRANTLLFDIQPGEFAAVKDFLQTHNLAAIAASPIITMRLTAINGRKVAEIQRDPTLSVPLWTLRREYRSTYRKDVGATEQIVSGEWISQWDVKKQPVPISIEEGLAEKLGVGLGDRLEFNVQGIDIETEIRSVRRVDWKRVHPNFFIVFPEGILEEAPQFFVIATHTASPELGAKFQQQLLQSFPSVSVIDATLILRTVDEISRRLVIITNTLMSIVIACALAILFAVGVNSREVRREENLLLRVLGATTRHTLAISLAEFGLLGSIAAFSGTVLGVIAYSVIAWQIFGLHTPPDVLSPVVILLLVTLLTTAIGMVSVGGSRREGPLRGLKDSS